MTLHIVAVDGLSTTAQDIRLALGALLVPRLDIGARTGVLYGLTVTALPTPGWKVRVAVGAAVVRAATAAGGAPIMVNDDVYTADVDPSTSQPRRDLVVMRWYSETTALESRGVRIEVVKGTPAASDPAAPAVPSNAIVLAELTIGANAASVGTNAIVPRRQFTSALGGITPSLSAGDVDGIYVGQYRDRTDTGEQERWNGSSWQVTASPNWQAYTPTWTADTNNVSRQNGTLTGRYNRVGRTCHVRIELVAGSQTRFGTGGYRWALPFPAASGGGRQIMQALLQSGSYYNVGAAFVGSGDDTAQALFPSGNANDADVASSTVPIPWVAGMRLVIQGTYETAQ